MHCSDFVCAQSGQKPNIKCDKLNKNLWARTHMYKNTYLLTYTHYSLTLTIKTVTTTRLPSNLRLTIHEWMHLVMYSHLWPWPWPDDLHIQIWPIFLEMCKYELPTWRLSKVIIWQSETDRQTHTTEIIKHTASRVIKRHNCYQTHELSALLGSSSAHLIRSTTSTSPSVNFTDTEK